MKKIKAGLILCLILCVTALSACGLVDKPKGDQDEEEQRFDELLCGYFLYFLKDADEAFPTKDFNDKEAVYTYVTRRTPEDPLSPYEIRANGDYFCENDYRVEGNGLAAGGTIALQTTLYFTYELASSTMILNRVNYLAKTQTVAIGNASAYGLDNGILASSTATVSQRLEENNQEGEAAGLSVFESSCQIKTIFCDYLITVRILEYDVDHTLLSQFDYAKGDDPSYVADNNTAYVVVEEEYEVKTNTNPNRPKGTIYRKRTLIERGFGEADSFVTLKYPRGNGLIQPIVLRVLFE